VHAGSDAALGVEEDAALVFGVLGIVLVEDGQGVVVRGAVEVGRVEVVAAGIEGGFDGGEDGLVRERIVAPGEA